MPTIRLLALLAILPGVASAADPVTFEKDVKPIFKQHCIGCHNGDKPRGGLDLSTLTAVREGGTSGQVVVAGKSEASLLYALPAHLEDPKMPSGKPKIPQGQLDVIRAWIDGGLKDKAGTSPMPPWRAAWSRPSRSPATPITVLAVSPTAPLVAVSSRQQVLLFRLPATEPLGALSFPEGEVHVLRFSRDGRMLLVGGGVGGQSGKVVGFDTATWRRAFEVGDEADVVLAADVTADRSKVVLGGPGRVVKVFSTADGKQLHAFRKPTDWVLSVGFSPEGLLVAAGDRFGGLYVWEAKSGKEFLTLRGHTKAVTGIAWRADSNAFASASEDGTVRVWDMHTGVDSAKWEAHPGGVLGADFHPGGTLATGGRDNRVKLWDGNGKPIADLGPASDLVLRVGIGPEAKTVLSGDWSGEVRVWPANGGQSVKLHVPVASKPAVADVIPVPTPTLRPSSPARAPSLADLQKDLAAARKALAAANDAVRSAEKTLGKVSGASSNGGTQTAGEGKEAVLKATTEALTQLKAAAALAPDNVALAQAVSATERAVKELTAELERR